MAKLTGLVAEYLSKKFGGSFAARSQPKAVGTTSEKFLNNDPERAFVFIANIGTELVTINIGGNAASGNGWLLAPNGGTQSFNLVEDFILPSRDFHAISAGAGSTLQVTTVRRIAMSDADADALPPK